MEESVNEAVITTQHYCSVLNEEIKRIQSVLLQKCLTSDISPPSASSVAAAKLSRLKAELEQEVNDEFTAPLHHPLVVSAQLLRSLDLTVEQTKQLIQVAKVRCTSLDKDIEDKENLILEQSKLQEALLERLQSQPDPPTEVEDSEFAKSYNEELSKKKQQSEKMRRDVKRKMKTFIQRHFPPPKPPRSGVAFVDGFASLSDVIDDLTTLVINKPEDPYLTIGSQHWPPYIELLLSHGLVRRHPSNINKIKLLDLHL